MAGYVFALGVALVLPVLVSLVLVRRYRALQPVLLGAACFILFQVLLRIPLLQFVLPRSNEYLLFQFTQPRLFLWFLSLTAGLFEETGRYVLMRRFMKDAPLSHAIAFGVGHGGMEAMLLVGLNLAVGGYLGQLPFQSSLPFVLAGAERILAMALHVCLSILVWRSLKENKPLLLALAILAHTLFNALGAELAWRNVDAVLIEGALALATVGIVIYTLFTLKTIRTDQRSIES